MNKIIAAQLCHLSYMDGEYAGREEMKAKILAYLKRKASEPVWSEDYVCAVEHVMLQIEEM